MVHIRGCQTEKDFKRMLKNRNAYKYQMRSNVWIEENNIKLKWRMHLMKTRMIYVFLFLLVVLSFNSYATTTEQKIVQDNITLEVKQGGHLKLFNNFGEYSFDITNDTESSYSYNFLSIQMLECEIEGLANLTGRFIEKCDTIIPGCYDIDGIAYKWKWESLKEDFTKIQEDNQLCNNNLTEIGTKNLELNNQMIMCASDKNYCEKVKNDLETKLNPWVAFVIGIILGSLGYYLYTHRNKKIGSGPQHDFKREYVASPEHKAHGLPLAGDNKP